jgi:hypothetical protein
VSVGVGSGDMLVTRIEIPAGGGSTGEGGGGNRSETERKLEELSRRREELMGKKEDLERDTQVRWILCYLSQ